MLPLETIKKFRYVIHPWMFFAHLEKGQKEIRGKSRHNSRILKYHSTVLTNRGKTLKTDEAAWCSAFVNWCLKKAGIIGTNSTGAKSWLRWGKRLNEGVFGCVVIFRRTGGGHVGFYVATQGNHILVLGGNQNDAVNIKKYKKADVLGYRWPKNSFCFELLTD